MFNANKFLKLLILVLIVVFLGFAILRELRKPAETAFLRGRAAAERLGCFGCHGDGGLRFWPNGEDEENIPSWNGGTAMMYIKEEKEIREWILYGRPNRLTDVDDEYEGNHIVRMPAYKDIITEQELADIEVYFKTVAEILKYPNDTVAAGARVAETFACFACHGPGGRGGVHNPGSFSGFVPPWEGDDFRELVKNDDELREWIRKGKLSRLEKNPFARFFTERQKIKMPAYEFLLSKEEEKQVIEYVKYNVSLNEE